MPPSNWTRSHDAWIAEKCEGLRLMDPEHVEHLERGGEAGWHDRVPLSHYSTDIAAQIRAANAWAAKEGGRYWKIVSAGHNWFKNGNVARAFCFAEAPLDIIAGIGDDEAALAWALYRATGGKE